MNGSKSHVFAIGLGGEVDEPKLRALGKDGFHPAAQSGQLKDAFAEIANRIVALSSRFYLLEYCSPKRGGVHRLSVRATLPSDQGGASGSLSRNLRPAGSSRGARCSGTSLPAGSSRVCAAADTGVGGRAPDGCGGAAVRGCSRALPRARMVLLWRGHRNAGDFDAAPVRASPRSSPFDPGRERPSTVAAIKMPR